MMEDIATVFHSVTRLSFVWTDAGFTSSAHLSFVLAGACPTLCKMGLTVLGGLFKCYSSRYCFKRPCNRPLFGLLTLTVLIMTMGFCFMTIGLMHWDLHNVSCLKAFYITKTWFEYRFADAHAIVCCTCERPTSSNYSMWFEFVMCNTCSSCTKKVMRNFLEPLLYGCNSPMPKNLECYSHGWWLLLAGHRRNCHSRNSATQVTEC